MKQGCLKRLTQKQSYLINSSAIVNPIPDPPPVTKATLPLQNMCWYTTISHDNCSCSMWGSKHCLQSRGAHNISFVQIQGMVLWFFVSIKGMIFGDFVSLRVRFGNTSWWCICFTAYYSFTPSGSALTNPGACGAVSFTPDMNLQPIIRTEAICSFSTSSSNQMHKHMLWIIS